MMKILALFVLVFMGVFLSAIADEVWSLMRRSVRRPGVREEEPTGDEDFFEAVFSLLGKTAKADGQVSADEIRVVEEFMSEVLRLSTESRIRAIRIFQEAKNDSRSVKDIAANFFARYHRQPIMLRRLVDLLLAVAHADKHLSVHEDALIREVLSVFGMNPRGFRVWDEERRGSSNTTGPYAVLGCTPGDAHEVVRRRYRELVLRYHPDRLSGKGTDGAFREFAMGKFREIQEAYTLIKRERGWS